MRKAYTASSLFTGSEWLKNFTIFTNNGCVDQLLSYSEAGSGIVSDRLDDSFIIPGYIDVQIYGAAQKLFSAFPFRESLELISTTLLKQGTILFLPTIATNSSHVIKSSIDAVREYQKTNGLGVAGLHLEGPWINPKRKGAHIEEYIRIPELNEIQDLINYADGAIKMITLAPECCSPEIIDLIKKSGIVTSIGHSDIDFDSAMHGFNQGIPAVTHLFNAMNSFHHRTPGLAAATFLHEKVKASIIPDGHHVSYEVLKIAKKLMGDRLFAITDAVTETCEGPYRHQLEGDKYVANGILSGSGLSMHKAMLNLINHCSIGLDEAIRMCSLYPAQLLGLDKEYGKIAPGYKAQFLVLNKSLEITRIINDQPE